MGVQALVSMFVLGLVFACCDGADQAEKSINWD
jgi:hypothetical protein